MPSSLAGLTDHPGVWPDRRLTPEAGAIVQHAIRRYSDAVRRIDELDRRLARLYGRDDLEAIPALVSVYGLIETMTELARVVQIATGDPAWTEQIARLERLSGPAEQTVRNAVAAAIAWRVS